jgi:hypothetical protein
VLDMTVTLDSVCFFSKIKFELQNSLLNAVHNCGDADVCKAETSYEGQNT